MLAMSWQISAILRLVVAAGLGALIGLEREHHGRAAGLRTQLLAALGAALAMVVSLHFADVYALSGPAIRVDPARVAYGVMGGIGFIGAGAIIHHGAGVRGLTTAASLWCSAAIGLAAGFGMYAVAIAATVLVLFALMALEVVVALIPERVTRRITLTVPETSSEALARYRGLLAGRRTKVLNVESACDFQNHQSTLCFDVSARAAELPKALDRLRAAAPEMLRMTVE